MNLIDLFKEWSPGLTDLGWKLLMAVLIILVGQRVIKWMGGMLRKTFHRMEMDLSLSRFLLSVMNAGAYALVIFIAAEKIGVPSASIVALIGSAGLAVGLALQGSLANFAGGILILVMRPFAVKDYIVCSGVEGTVTDIGLVYTTLVTVDNKKVTIPNGTLSNSTLVNVTAQDRRRVDLKIGISYGADLKRAKEILLEIYKAHPLVIQEEEVVGFVDELAESAVIIGGRGWARTEDYWTVKWDITESVKARFDQEGIQIPYRQLDVNLKRE